MARKISGDIIPKRKAELLESLHKKRMVEEHTLKFEPARGKKGRGIIWKISLLVIVVLLISFGLWQESYLFSYAKIKIVPRGQNLNLDLIVNASRNLKIAQISLKTVKLSAEQASTVSATVKKQISEKATGEVIMYNAFDSKPQELVARTRLETPEGKIFRLVKDVIVPGYKVIGGKKIPGSTVTIAQASVPGKEYNIGLKDFTLPAFKGTGRYGTIYARSKTPLAGGKIENVLVPSDEDLSKTSASIESKLKPMLRESIGNQIPQGYMIFEDGIFYRIDDPILSNSGTTLTRKGTIEAILLNKEELTRYIAKKKISEYADEPVNLIGFDGLKINILNKATLEPEKLMDVELKIKGNASIVYSLDSDSFRSALSALPKAQYAAVLSKYPAIDTADISFTPNWALNFPSDADRIQVEIIDTAVNNGRI
ncbi:MAG: hypothetical protein HZA95_01920 [Candidatus Vogelbacteria bacterium]|nr:hypothetical protein [Candidatus Vogelbacteria bacterium]